MEGPSNRHGPSPCDILLKSSSQYTPLSGRNICFVQRPHLALSVVCQSFPVSPASEADRSRLLTVTRGWHTAFILVVVVTCCFLILYKTTGSLNCLLSCTHIFSPVRSELFSTERVSHTTFFMDGTLLLSPLNGILQMFFS